MSELIACIIAYNEARLLPGCLESIRHKVDKIVVVEGRIETFPGKWAYSTDNTVGIAKEAGAQVITSPTPWADEATMRNQFLVGNEGDWYIIIDADERCMTQLPNIHSLPANIHAYSIMVKMIGDGHGKYRPRLFRHRGKMEFREIHDALFSDGVLVSNPQNVPHLNSVWFAHRQMDRCRERQSQKQQYYKHGYAHEPAYRKEWKMNNAHNK